MRALLARLLLLSIALAALPAHAQITFRGAGSASGTSLQIGPPAFRAATSAATTTGTLTIATPSGMQDRDILIASIAVTPSSATITPPPLENWTLVRRLDNAGPTSNSLAVYYKIIFVSGQPASYAFGVTGASFAVGGLQAFSGVDTDGPVAVENGLSTPSGTAHSAPAITTSLPNSMLVTSHAFASSRTWTPPAGMTESFDQPSGANSATGLSIEGSRVLQALPGTTGDKTATAAGNADAGNAHILALRPPKSKVTLPIPAGTSAGDVMIAAIAFNNSSAPIQVFASGWTLVRRIDNAGATSNSLAVYRKTATGSEAGPSWTVPGGAFLVGGIQVFSGADPTNPIDAESGQSTPSGTNHDTPSITTSTANTMLVTTHTFASSQSWTPQVGLTEAYDRLHGTAGATGQSITGTFQAQAAAGASGAKRSTAAGTADVGNTHILALRPLSNVAPTVSLTSPANGATFNAPANVPLAATAADSDGTVSSVAFYNGTNLITTLTSAPYSFTWTGVPQGSYSLTAKATDNLGVTTTSAPVSVTVNRAAALHFIHVDHLNTPRLVADSTGTTVWKWDQQEPFGNSVPDENPSGLGAFDLPLRLPGQYFDKETGLHYSYFRDCYDSGTGRFCQPDPIGTALFEGMAFRSLGTLGLAKPELEGRLYSDEPRYNHLYAYAANNPVANSDPDGLFPMLGGPLGASASTSSSTSSSSNAQSCGFSWKDERRACRDSCVAIGRAMGGISGQAYTSRCTMMCNLTYTKP